MIKLHSNIIGDKGQPLLILHGFLGMGDNWKTLAKKYNKEGFQVHLIDQRNHGRSPHTTQFNYDVLAADIVDYCQQHQLKDIYLLGHSMGGKAAMQVAVKYPELLNALLVIDIAPKYYPPHHQTILEGLTALYEAHLTDRGDADTLLATYISDWGVRQFLLKNLYWKDKETLALRMNLPVLKEKIEQIGTSISDDAVYMGKTLFINGKKSNYITENDKDLILKHFPNAEIVPIEGAGHWVHAEKAKEFFEKTMLFMKKID